MKKKQQSSPLERAIIRRAKAQDINAMAHIGITAFSGFNNDVLETISWMRSLHRAHGIYHYYVCDLDGVIAGYIGWQLHGGFGRTEASLELEQIAIHPDHRGDGLGGKLIEESRDDMLTWLSTAPAQPMLAFCLGICRQRRIAFVFSIVPARRSWHARAIREA